MNDSRIFEWSQCERGSLTLIAAAHVRTLTTAMRLAGIFASLVLASLASYVPGTTGFVRPATLHGHNHKQTWAPRPRSLAAVSKMVDSLKSDPHRHPLCCKPFRPHQPLPTLGSTTLSRRCWTRRKHLCWWISMLNGVAPARYWATGLLGYCARPSRQAKPCRWESDGSSHISSSRDATVSHELKSLIPDPPPDPENPEPENPGP